MIYNIIGFTAAAIKGQQYFRSEFRPLSKKALRRRQRHSIKYWSRSELRRYIEAVKDRPHFMGAFDDLNAARELILSNPHISECGYYEVICIEPYELNTFCGEDLNTVWFEYEKGGYVEIPKPKWAEETCGWLS